VCSRLCPELHFDFVCELAKIVVHNVGDYTTVWNTTQNNFGMVGISKECFLHCEIQCGRLFCDGGYTLYSTPPNNYYTQNNIFLTLRAFHSPSLATFNPNLVCEKPNPS